MKALTENEKDIIKIAPDGVQMKTKIKIKHGVAHILSDKEISRRKDFEKLRKEIQDIYSTAINALYLLYPEFSVNIKR